MMFFRASAESTNSFFPNVDNAYVSAFIRPAAGTVVVVRGKAPTTPSGTSPVPWPQSGLQLRYFSLCNNVYRSPWPVVANPVAGGGTEYGCAADYETKLDAQGDYAYVVAKPSQRAAVEAAGGTFIPLSTTQPNARQILIFRNMLPNRLRLTRPQPRRWMRLPSGPKMPISSAGPSTAPNQCGVQVLNSAASPGSRTCSASPRIRRSRPERT